jgi:protein O-GlcNAc transferase
MTPQEANEQGLKLYQAGRQKEALAAFDQALAHDPGFAAAWNNKGLALNGLGRMEEALASFARAAQLVPASAAPLSNQGETLWRLKRYEEALASFSRALAIDPGDLAALVNRAAALTDLGRIDEAIADYDEVLFRNPNLPQALFGRSHLLWTHKGELKPALADLARLIEAAPDYPLGRGQLMRLKLTAADWDDFAAQKTMLDEGVRAGKPLIAPLIYLALSDQPEDIHRCAQIYSELNFPARPPMYRKGPRRPGPIRIGYVCGEFRTQATLYLMAGLFEAHDRSEFEIVAFDNGGSDGSPLRARFEKAVNRIIDITHLPDRDAAARIMAEDIDILVDLNGYSGQQRMGIFALKPAPLQVSYLAWPGTLGASYFDYFLADKVVVPQTQQAHYSEKIAWLPDSFQINDDKRDLPEPPTRAQAGLPAQGFVFCNFNHAEKRSPQAFASWMRILAAVPGSVLWLPRPHVLGQENLIREAEKYGIAPERLIFAAHAPSFAEHLGRMVLADLFLDAFPYGAHTIASDALWAGVPLVTLMGNAFAGRVAPSLLMALGLPELVTHGVEEYEALALQLARQPDRLAALREKLARARTTAPLFDTKRTTRAIERAYRIMLEKNRPESFAVPD